jgi:serine phosphatase RsbU (regulator of sigma subunit)
MTSDAHTMYGNTMAPITSLGSGTFPTLVVVHGDEQQTTIISKSPFSIGRRTGHDLVIPDPRVSRDHAMILYESGEFSVVDQGSRHGTFVNGQKVTRQKLQRDDRVEFGVRESFYAIFHPKQQGSNSAREFLSQIAEVRISTDGTDLEKLTLFLEAARKLNTIGVLDEILTTLLETTLKLTHAERGYVFLKETGGQVRLAAGRNSKGEPLLDDNTISHSIVKDAMDSASEFLITDTSMSDDLAARQSIANFDLRSVICLPLHRPEVQARRGDATAASGEVIGVLYMDSRFASRTMTGVSHDILRAISTEAASLLENARLVQAEEAARRYQQELSIAASIQQRLMSVTIPEVPYVKLQARNIPCKEIGGDFFDAVESELGLSIVLADVCGKGVSAALLANTLQGMVYSQLATGKPLTEIVSGVNRFFCQKHLGEKYATVVILNVHPSGEVEYVNCGHVQPLLVTDGKVTRPEHGNLPVGLLPDATYESAKFHLKKGDRLILVTDGVTEAENKEGELFEGDRLEHVIAEGRSFEEIFEAVRTFCAGTPLNDDCTVIDLAFTGGAQVLASPGP